MKGLGGVQGVRPWPGPGGRQGRATGHEVVPSSNVVKRSAISAGHGSPLSWFCLPPVGTAFAKGGGMVWRARPGVDVRSGAEVEHEVEHVVSRSRRHADTNSLSDLRTVLRTFSKTCFSFLLESASGQKAAHGPGLVDG